MMLRSTSHLIIYSLMDYYQTLAQTLNINWKISIIVRMAQSKCVSAILLLLVILNTGLHFAVVYYSYQYDSSHQHWFYYGFLCAAGGLVTIFCLLQLFGYACCSAAYKCSWYLTNSSLLLSFAIAAVLSIYASLLSYNLAQEAIALSDHSYAYKRYFYLTCVDAGVTWIFSVALLGCIMGAKNDQVWKRYDQVGAGVDPHGYPYTDARIVS